MEPRASDGTSTPLYWATPEPSNRFWTTSAQKTSQEGMSGIQEAASPSHLPSSPRGEKKKKREREIGEVTCLADSAVDVICDRLSNQTVIFISLFHIYCCNVCGQDVRIATSIKQCWPQFSELPLLFYRSQDTPGETFSFSYMHVCCVQHSCAGNA